MLYKLPTLQYTQTFLSKNLARKWSLSNNWVSEFFSLFYGIFQFMILGNLLIKYLANQVSWTINYLAYRCFSIFQLIKCDASQQLKKSWLLEDFVENQPLKISWDAETSDLVRLVNYGKSIHGKSLPEKKLTTLVMFYKQHCKWRTSFSFSKFHSRCLAVAYFPQTNRLVLLLSFLLMWSLLIFLNL